MKINLKPYIQTITELPQSGQHILAYQQDDLLVVYQAYKPSIADFAVANQRFGADYSFSRMSWIKPNFLWMMYRCGWAEKENQERVLAIWIRQAQFEDILSKAAYASFSQSQHSDHHQWREELNNKEVRLQWDPDHDPFGKKLERRAIQLGLKGQTLHDFNQRIVEIEDITPFVTEQKKILNAEKLDELMVPVETLFRTSDEGLNRLIGI